MGFEALAIPTIEHGFLAVATRKAALGGRDMEQHHIGLGNQAVLSGGRALKEGSGVHPGWFTMPVIEFESTQEQDDTSRFQAFMQLLRTAGALDRAATDVLADLDLTAGAFGALLELGEVTPGGLAPSELARRLCVARRTATLYVDILERQGWATRQAHPDDRRMVLATLTPSGLHLISELGDAYKRRLASLLTDMSALTADRLRQILCSIDSEQAIRMANQV